MDGILNVYKESGYTSHDVVACLRKILNMKKIGHTGTLDPMAEGVLPVCVGNATKLCESLTDHDKEYEAVMILGKTYDTLDITGVINEIREVMSTKEEITDAIKSFIGGYDQVPPMYSAKKVDGKKLYDLARSGKVIERAPVPGRIDDIEIISVDIPHVTIRVRCGKGTYIRSLIDDIGRKLGCGAAMEKLKRTASGDFTAATAHTLSEIEEAVSSGKIADVMISLGTFFADLPEIRTSPEASRLLRNGNVIPGRMTRPEDGGDATLPHPDGCRIRMYDAGGIFTGVYEYIETDDIYKPYKMFLS